MIDAQDMTVPEWGGPDWAKLVTFGDALPSFLHACTSAYTERDLLVLDARRISYSEAEAQSALLARALLADGVGKGMRIGLIMPNSPDFLVAFFAITRIGAVAVPISTLSTEQELAHIVEHADLARLISIDRFLSHDYLTRLEDALGLDNAIPPFLLEVAPFLREIRIVGAQRPWSRPLLDEDAPRASPVTLVAAERSVAACDPIAIIYTSGSTGAPKGVIHCHGAFVRQARKLAAVMPYQPGDRQALTAPMFWVGGLVVGVLSAMPIGAATMFASGGAEAILDLAERERATYIFVWPHLARQIASHPTFASRDLSTMIGGSIVEAIPANLRRRNQIFGQALGMSETAGPHTMVLPDVPDDMIGSFGPPMPGMEHRIVDVETRAPLPDGEQGELEVRGDALMLGYVRKERNEVFSPDGWFATGDRCSFRRGCLFFHGRVDDMIKSAGANVSPLEVETALRTLPGIDAAHVAGVRDVTRGSTVGAAVVLAPGATLTESDIRAHARQTLSSYKVPRVIWICTADQLPLTGSNKIAKPALSSLLERIVDAAADPGRVPA